MSDNAGMEKFKHEREEIAKLLRSEGGKALLRRLKPDWDADFLMGDTSEQTAYRVGKRDAYRELEELAKERNT